MYLRAALKSIGDPPTKARRAAVRLATTAYASSLLCTAAFAQTASPSLPEPVFSDLTVVTRCLAGEGCTDSPRQPATKSAPRSACVAEETLKTMPAQMRAESRAFSQSEAVARCHAATAAIAPLSESIRAAYLGELQTAQTSGQKTAARNYIDACMSPQVLTNAGPLTAIEEAYLQASVGLIVERRNPQWGGPRPICTAMALGRYVITARSCLPAAVTAQTQRGALLEDIAFRFFDRPTLYGLSLHRFGTDRDPSIDPELDFALLETVNAPELQMPEARVPPLGTMRLNEDFFALTTDIFLRVAAGDRGGANFDLNRTTRIQHSTTCRPAHIEPNGLFLHACDMAASVVTRGAPLFQRQYGQLVFVGIQSGATKSLGDRALASCAPGLPNYGIAIPPDVLVQTFLK